MEPDNQKSAATQLQQVVAEQENKLKEQEKYMKALVEEFTSTSDFEEVRQKFREKLKEFAPAALINIINLANNAESESVRANLNKWVLDWAMSDKIENTGSDLAKLLKDLQTKDPANTTTSE